MEARSKRFCNRCNASGLEKNVCFCILTFQLDRSSDKQGSSIKCRNNDTSDTHMAEKNPGILSSKKVYTMSIAFTSLPNLLPLIPWEKKPSCENQVPKVRAVKNNRKALEMEGISSNVIKFISMPRGLDFLTGSKWVSWCCWQKIDPVWAPLSEYWTIY